MPHARLLYIAPTVLAIGFMITTVASGETTLPDIFSSGMVLQRHKPVLIWGGSDPGATVTVTFGDQKVSAVADAQGKWRINFKPMRASSPGREIRITSTAAAKPVVLEDVVVGDVWLCSGQSNMEWPLNATLDWQSQAKTANYPFIRQFKIPRKTATEPQSNAIGNWQICSSTTCGAFTGVGFYFAKKLHGELGIPIGLINASYGASKIEPWTPPVGFAMVPELQAVPAMSGIEAPAAMYNAMIHPLIPYSIRGVLWYQGESNRTESISYFHKKQALIGGWRKLWDEDLPFYFVQLTKMENAANLQRLYWVARFREMQTKCLSIPNTAMVVTIDVSSPTEHENGSGHPINKLDVGTRLALCALGKEYGKTQVVFSGPMYKRFAIEGSAIRIDFDHVGAGLMVGAKAGQSPTRQLPDGQLRSFAIAGQDRVWHLAEAIIDGDTVVVSSDEVRVPVAVRYVFGMDPAGANLYNKDGLPAVPFRTDDWLR